jgi:hypothetical protein
LTNEVLVAVLDRHHPASEVYVTGTFDEWKKTEKLENVGDHFEKKVTLPDSSSKIYYKVRRIIYHIYFGLSLRPSLLSSLSIYVLLRLKPVRHI